MSTGINLEKIEGVDKEQREVALKEESDALELKLLRENKSELEAIVNNSIDINNETTALTYGEETANIIANTSDDILRSMKSVDVNKSSELMNQLGSIMSNFDLEEFSKIGEEEKKNFIQKLFSKAKKTIDDMLNEYETIGGEVDKIYLELKKYEQEIDENNEILNNMFKENEEYYISLKKHIVAGDMATKELKENVIPSQEKIVNENPGDNLEERKLQEYRSYLDALEQRLYDLRLSENVSLQAYPMLAGIKKGNMNLIRKINSAFIITMPIFKQSLSRAIMLKRQAIQTKSMAMLDDVTNEMIEKNAQMVKQGMTQTAKLANKSSIDIEKLESSWNTIKEGIEETRMLEENLRKERNGDIQKLNLLRKDIKSIENKK